METNLDLDNEAAQLAYMQINYYVNIPKHIKGSVVEITGLEPNVSNKDGTCDVAFVVSGTTTVVCGKLNMPTLHYRQQFNEQSISHHPVN